ncbi:MAG: DegV family protein [Bacillota bacterium]
MKIKYLDGSRLYYAFLSGAQEVINNREELNNINVFPVADGDTGTNMSRTLQMILQKINEDYSLKSLVDVMSEQALKGAIGNSGIIFAQFINGFNNSLNFLTIENRRLNVNNFSSAVDGAVTYTYQGVSNPVEGTVLTVMREWSQSLQEIKEKTDDFEELMLESFKKANISLNETKNQLEVLKKSDVVDSGALGFIYFLKGIVNLIRNGNIKKTVKEIIVPEFKKEVIDKEQKLDYRFCTEVYLENAEKEKDEIKSDISTLGESIIIAGDKKKMRIHIHTNQPAVFFNKINGISHIIDQKVDDMLIQYNVKYRQKSEIALVTDSIADIPEDFILEKQIHVIPINIIIDDTVFLDKLTLKSDNFFDKADKADKYLHSSQPSVEVVENKLSFLADHYKSVIIITVAQKLSGTYNNIKKAAEKFKDEIDIAVIDSKLNSAAQALLVMEAAGQIDEKNSFKDIVKYINKIKNNIYIYVSVDDFKYMVRGGRVSPLKGRLASFLNLKPVITLNKDGSGKAFAAAFSTGANTRKIKNIISRHLKKEGIKKYAIVHADASEKAEEYKNIFSALIDKKPEFVENISAAVALNSGRGSVAISILTGEDW